jgi:hypothetical protein
MIKEIEIWRGHVTSITDEYISVDTTDTKDQRVIFEVDIENISLEDQKDMVVGCDFEAKIVIFSDGTSKTLFHIPSPRIWTKEDIKEIEKSVEKYHSIFDKEGD